MSLQVARTGVVLAGGRGERMGATKPLLEHRGRLLLHVALDALAPWCREVLVMAGPHGARLAPVARGARVLADPGEGPPRALALAATLARYGEMLVLPADLPRVTSGALAPLVEAGADAVFELDGVGQSLVAMYRRSTLRAFAGRSLQEIPAHRVDGAAWREQLRDADEPSDLADP